MFEKTQAVHNYTTFDGKSNDKLRRIPSFYEYNKICLWGEVYELRLEKVFVNVNDNTDIVEEYVDSVGEYTFNDDYTVEQAIEDNWGLKQGEYELVEK